MENISSDFEIETGFIVDGRYEIIDRIGSGGFSTVYRAKHVKMNREAAIKILSSELLGEENWKERFMREAQICASFSHPNVVMIYDLGTIPETGQPYIAMELLKGHNLAVELSKNGPLSKQRFYHLFRPVLDALGAGHAAGIVHRDLKPENLFIINPGTKNEFMKVMDFGISSMKHQKLKRLTMNGEVLGTPRFLAPEYIKDSVVCPAGDVYQMALIMSEALSSVPAVEDNSMAAMLLHTEGNIYICEFLKTGSVGSVFSRAYCVEKEKRYEDCRRFCEAFDSVCRYFDCTSMGANSENTQNLIDASENYVIDENDDFNVATKRGRTHISLLILLSVIIGALCVMIAAYFYIKSNEKNVEELVTAEMNSSDDSSSNINSKDESASKFDEQSLVESLHLCKLEDTDELHELRKEAENSSAAKEKLGVYLMRLAKCRDNFDEAWKAFEGVEMHKDPDAMFYHGLLGIIRWSQNVHMMTANEMQKFKKYKDYIHEAAQNGSLIAVAGAFRFLEKPLNHEEMAQLILDAVNDPNQDFSDTRNWIRIAQGVLLAVNENSSDYNKILKIYRELLNKSKIVISNAVKDNNAMAMTIHGMMIAKSNPDESYLMFKKAADAGCVEANRILADVYMHTMTEKMLNETILPLQAYKALQKIVQKRLKSLDEMDRFKLVADYIKHSGTDPLDVYHFYRALHINSDEFADIVLERMRDAAVNDLNVRYECNLLAEHVGVDITWEKKPVNSVFPDSKQQKVFEVLEACYRSALEIGSDFSEVNFDNSELSSGYILYLLYKNAFDSQNDDNKNKMAGTLLYAAEHGDGISAGTLAHEYQKGEILPADERKVKYWAEQCMNSQYCRDCLKMDLAMCSLCDDCHSLAKME